MKKIFTASLLILLAGCGTMVKRPQLPSVLTEREASILYIQYRVTERGSYFLKKYNFNGTGFRGPELSPLFEAPYVKEETAAAFDRFNIYSVTALTGALGGGFSLAYNFGRMGADKSTNTWVWLGGGTGTAAMFLFQYLAERAASEAFRRYNFDLQIRLGLAPGETAKTSPLEKKPGAVSTSPSGIQALMGLSVRF